MIFDTVDGNVELDVANVIADECGDVGGIAKVEESL